MLFFFMYVAILVTINGECYVAIATPDQTDNNMMTYYTRSRMSQSEQCQWSTSVSKL